MPVHPATNRVAEVAVSCPVAAAVAAVETAGAAAEAAPTAEVAAADAADSTTCAAAAKETEELVSPPTLNSPLLESNYLLQ